MYVEDTRMQHQHINQIEAVNAQVDDAVKRLSREATFDAMLEAATKAADQIAPAGAALVEDDGPGADEDPGVEGIGLVCRLPTSESEYVC